MGILLGFVLVCLIIYAVLVTHGLYLFFKLILVRWLGVGISVQLLWLIINVTLWLLACRFIYTMMLDARGGTPNMEPVWKFYIALNTILFLIVFLLGYKSK
ncbi:MAG: hypothetical protein IPJ54_06400 [Saprospiraceae bacterium]|nr:hypothetical protein [Saprospiraceae bacterium]MBK8111236.1 hypothetical protein [Saprospiraceae bacterium]